MFERLIFLIQSFFKPLSITPLPAMKQESSIFHLSTSKPLYSNFNLGWLVSILSARLFGITEERFAETRGYIFKCRSCCRRRFLAELGSSLVCEPVKLTNDVK